MEVAGEDFGGENKFCFLGHLELQNVQKGGACHGGPPYISGLPHMYGGPPIRATHLLMYFVIQGVETI